MFGDGGFSLGSPSVGPSGGGVGGGREGSFPFLRLPGGGVGTIVAQTWLLVPPALASWRQPCLLDPSSPPELQAYYSPRTFSHHPCGLKQGGQILYGTDTGFPTWSTVRLRREVERGIMSGGELI